MKIVGKLVLVFIVLMSFVLSGCAPFGARRLPGDRFDYNAALAESSREQMMLNLVRIRNLEPPVFMTVSSVVTQYAYTGDLGVQASSEDVSGDVPSVTTDFIGGGANVGYSELPTITYLPVGGGEFSSRLLAKIPAEVFFAAMRDSWAVDLLMRIGLERFGTARNVPSAISSVGARWPADRSQFEGFARVTDLLSILMQAGIIEIFDIEQKGKDGAESQQFLQIARRVPEDLRPALAEFRQLAGLSNRTRFRITDRITGGQGDEITVQTRSLKAIMQFVARGVEVPPEYFAQGRVVDYGLQAMESQDTYYQLVPFQMRVSKNRPADAYGAVRHQGYWYYVDQNDITSKHVLALASVLYQLTAPASKGAAPILTL